MCVRVCVYMSVHKHRRVRIHTQNTYIYIYTKSKLKQKTKHSHKLEVKRRKRTKVINETTKNLPNTLENMCVRVCVYMSVHKNRRVRIHTQNTCIYIHKKQTKTKKKPFT